MFCDTVWILKNTIICLHAKSIAMMLDVTGTVINANADPPVLVLLLYIWLHVLYTMPVFLGVIAKYRLTYSIAIY